MRSLPLPAVRIGNASSMILNLRHPATAAAAYRSGGFVFGTGTDSEDRIVGSKTEANALSGGARADIILGGPLGDELWGEGVFFPAVFPNPPITADLRGADTIFGFDGADSVHGDWGDDVVVGGQGNDILSGDDGHDQLSGSAGDDYLLGGDGRDTLRGGQGNDTLLGGKGADLLAGGAGADAFVVGATVDGRPEAGRDVISGFVQGEDRIDLSAVNHYSMFYGEHYDAAFSFAGEAVFVTPPLEGPGSAGPGQLRCEFRGSTTVVQIDVAEAKSFIAHALTSGPDGEVDAEIVLLGRYHLTAADFVL